MSLHTDGGPAYPQGESYYTTDLAGHQTDHRKAALHRGMSLRDYFAAAALQGMLSATKEDHPWPGADQYARLAHEFADAMLKARGVTPQSGAGR